MVATTSHSGVDIAASWRGYFTISNQNSVAEIHVAIASKSYTPIPLISFEKNINKIIVKSFHLITELSNITLTLQAVLLRHIIYIKIKHWFNKNHNYRLVFNKYLKLFPIIQYNYC